MRSWLRFTVNVRAEKLGAPTIAAMSGVSRSFTSAVTTATVKSSTFPRRDELFESLQHAALPSRRPDDRTPLEFAFVVAPVLPLKTLEDALMPTCLGTRSTILLALCATVAPRAFGESLTATMTVSVTVEPSCQVVLEHREAPALSCGAAFTGQPVPRIDVTPSQVEPASSTWPQGEPRLLIINF